MRPGVSWPDKNETLPDMHKHLTRVWEPEIYLKQREITVRVAVVPGTYVIIPATYYRDIEGEFLLRVFTEKSAKVTPRSER